MKILKITIVYFSLLIVLCGCQSTIKSAEEYMLEVKDLDSKQTLEYYFEAWNEKNLNKMLAVCPKSKGFDNNLNDLNYVKLISIELNNKYLSSDSSKETYEEEIYRATFEINVKGGYSDGFSDGQMVWDYKMLKVTEDSPWIVSTWGAPMTVK